MCVILEIYADFCGRFGSFVIRTSVCRHGVSLDARYCWCCCFWWCCCCCSRYCYFRRHECSFTLAMDFIRWLRSFRPPVELVRWCSSFSNQIEFPMVSCGFSISTSPTWQTRSFGKCLSHAKPQSHSNAAIRLAGDGCGDRKIPTDLALLAFIKKNYRKFVPKMCAPKIKIHFETVFNLENNQTTTTEINILYINKILIKKEKFFWLFDFWDHFSSFPCVCWPCDTMNLCVKFIKGLQSFNRTDADPNIVNANTNITCLPQFNKWKCYLFARNGKFLGNIITMCDAIFNSTK